MDSLTSLIVAAIPYVAEKVDGHGLKDAYEAIKAKIREVLGPNNTVSPALDELEADPNSKGRQQVLDEQITAAALRDDPRVVALAEALRASLQQEQPKLAVQQITVSVGVARDHAQVAGIIINH